MPDQIADTYRLFKPVIGRRNARQLAAAMKFLREHDGRQPRPPSAELDDALAHSVISIQFAEMMQSDEPPKFMRDRNRRECLYAIEQAHCRLRLLLDNPPDEVSTHRLAEARAKADAAEEVIWQIRTGAPIACRPVAQFKLWRSDRRNARQAARA